MTIPQKISRLQSLVKENTSISDHLLQQFESLAAATLINELNPCPADRKCRWFHPAKDGACKMCSRPLIENAEGKHV